MIRDGGQAFPAFERWVEHRDGYDVERSGPVDGMTMRDYFAAKALQALLAKEGSTADLCFGAFAECAYSYADAMLTARRRQ
jgi:hypothetical protein